MIWLTSDWHFGLMHMDWQNRPFECIEHMHDTIIWNHNELVCPNDTVVVVGDVCDRAQIEYLPEVARLNGRKILIRGNHDRGMPYAEFKKYFAAIYDEWWVVPFDLGSVPCWVTHYPTKARQDRLNIVGHIHDRWRVQKNMFNVGVDVNHFRPVPETAIPEILESIKSRYDDDVWVANHPANLAHSDRGKSGSYVDDLR